MGARLDGLTALTAEALVDRPWRCAKWWPALIGTEWDPRCGNYSLFHGGHCHVHVTPEEAAEWAALKAQMAAREARRSDPDLRAWREWYTQRALSRRLVKEVREAAAERESEQQKRAQHCVTGPIEGYVRLLGAVFSEPEPPVLDDQAYVRLHPDAVVTVTFSRVG
jgi:hypothetical protein